MAIHIPDYFQTFWAKKYLNIKAALSPDKFVDSEKFLKMENDFQEEVENNNLLKMRNRDLDSQLDSKIKELIEHQIKLSDSNKELKKTERKSEKHESEINTLVESNAEITELLTSSNSDNKKLKSQVEQLQSEMPKLELEIQSSQQLIEDHNVLNSWVINEIINKQNLDSKYKLTSEEIVEALKIFSERFYESVYKSTKPVSKDLFKLHKRVLIPLSIHRIIGYTEQFNYVYANTRNDALSEFLIKLHNLDPNDVKNEIVLPNLENISSPSYIGLKDLTDEKYDEMLKVLAKGEFKPISKIVESGKAMIDAMSKAT